ncbi:MAG: hypothetical protein KJ858_02495, partial [Nanoarchaeota archaeon]|nr:hypothetical protein [Nanoarchaeota archaeon]
MPSQTSPQKRDLTSSYPAPSTTPTNSVLSQTQLMLHPIGFIINLMSWLETKLFSKGFYNLYTI